MPIINCRGENTRAQLVQDFCITPLAHVRLLNGQTKESCAGPTLDREYYIFSYQNNADSEDRGTFVCGISAANDFINLIQKQNPAITRLPLFDPLASFGQVGTINNINQAATGRGDRQVPNWNLIAKELYDAIGMICLIWNLKNVGGALESVLLNLVSNPTQAPSDANIRSINTIICNKFKIGSLPKSSLASYFQDFMKRYNVTNPPLIMFPNLTNYITNILNTNSYFN